MAGSPFKWLKREYLSGKLKPSREALAKWPQLADLLAPPTDLQALALARTPLARSGREWIGPCPACSGRLRVGLDRWRCLDCAGQEIDGADLAGMRQFLSRCPK